MSRNAFVTGGTGFIGINLIELLVQKEWQITALHRSSSDLTQLNKFPVNLAEGSITDLDSLREAIPNDTDVVFHLAGDTNVWSQHNKRQTKINVNGTENMIRACAEKNVSTFIHTSSISAWGTVSGTITEDSPQKGHESWVNYEKTKWAGERKALKGLEHGMKVVILNPSMVIGPHDASNWGRLFFALRDGTLPGVTKGSLSVAHVQHVAEAHLSAVEHGRSGERYILGGINCKFADFVQVMAEIADVSEIPKTIPVPILKLFASFSAAKAYFTGEEPNLTPELAKMITRDVTFSSEKAKLELNYKIPPIRKSLQDCYDWLKTEELL